MGLRDQPQYTQIMLDLETAATSSDAVILSIGAAKFNAREVSPDTFYRVLSDADQQLAGRRVSEQTMAWWAQQSEEARAVFDAPKTTAATALNEFAEWLGPGNLQIWGNGADFDNIILGSLYEALGIKKPWSYSNNRCYRTLKNIAHPAANLPPRGGTHHNSLDDAVHQARCAILYLKGVLRA